MNKTKQALSIALWVIGSVILVAVMESDVSPLVENIFSVIVVGVAILIGLHSLANPGYTPQEYKELKDKERRPNDYKYTIK